MNRCLTLDTRHRHGAGGPKRITLAHGPKPTVYPALPRCSCLGAPQHRHQTGSVGGAKGQPDLLPHGFGRGSRLTWPTSAAPIT